MSDMSASESMPEASPTVSEALHATLSMPFEDAVLHVQLEHELAGFETVKVTRLDRLVEGMLGEEVERTALVVVCHPEVAREALAIDPTLVGLFPCTTVVYETADDDTVHVHHLSASKAIRDLGCSTDEAAVADLVELTGDRMATVWEHIERLGAAEETAADD